MEGGEQMKKRDAMKKTVPSHFIAQGVIPAFIVIIAVLAISDIRVVFEPPLLLFILNTLFISVMSFVVASISASNYLKRGSLSFLLLGCGVLALGSGGLVAGWLIGPPGGPNVNVTIYDTGALLGAVLHFTGAILASTGGTSDIILVLKPKSKMILAYLSVLVFTALLTIASLRGATPPYMIQGIGPTLLGRAVLGTAVALFGFSSLFFMRLYSKSKEAFEYWYSLALALIAVGLSAVFLQKAVGSPIGWAGRSAQYLGGIYFLVAVLITYMEGRLRISEEKLRSVFASSPDAITVIDLDGNILECSQSALDIHRCSSKDEMLGKDILEFIAKKDHERAMEGLKEISEQGSVKGIEYTFLTKDGREFAVELSASVTRDTYGNPTGFVVIARDITERKQAEAERKAAHELLQVTIDGVNKPILLIGTDYQVKLMNQAVRDGYPVGKGTEPLYCYQVFHHRDTPCSGAAHPCPLEQMRESPRPVTVVHEHVQLDGEKHLVEISVSPLLGEDGKLTGIVEAARDITERVRAEKQLRRQSAVLDGINKVLLETLTCESEEEMAHTFLAVAEELTGSQFGFICEVNQAGRFDTIAISNPGWDACTIRETEAVLMLNDLEIRGIRGRVIKDERSVIFNDPTSHPDWVGIPGGHPQITCFLGVPLKQAGRTIGMIGLANKESGYVLSDQQTIEALSVAFVEALNRKRAEEALRESEERYRSLFEDIPVGLYCTTPGGQILDANPALAEMLDYPDRDSLLEVNAADLYMNAEDRRRWQAIMEHEGVVQGFEAQLRRRDGTTIWGRDSARAIQDGEGRVLYYEGAVKDITEPKMAEEALRQRADDLAALYEASQAFLGHLDTEVILEGICRLAVDRFGLKMAWVGLVVEGSFDVRPAFAYGFEKGYLDSIRVTWDDSPTGRGPTGTAIRTGQATVMNHIESDSTYAPWREAAEARGYRSSAALPLRHGEQVLGALNVYSAEPAYFTAERIQVLQSFANQAAVAIQNAQLFEQVRAGREHLQALSRQLLEVQEAERRHIARELHDEVGQALTGLKLLLDMSTRLPPDEATASLGEAQAMVNELMTLVRDLSLDLRPAMLDDLGLLPTLLWHFERYTAQTHVGVTFTHTGLEGRRFTPEVETAAYRIVQEALTNVARHASVDQVAVRFWADQDTLGVQIEDRGTGFDPEAALAARATTGLAGMHERAVLLGGQLTVESAPGAGACVTAELPLAYEIE
jgi:PAS domain S-box-containing protein